MFSAELFDVVNIFSNVVLSLDFVHDFFLGVLVE